MRRPSRITLIVAGLIACFILLGTASWALVVSEADPAPAALADRVTDDLPGHREVLATLLPEAPAAPVAPEAPPPAPRSKAAQLKDSILAALGTSGAQTIAATVDVEGLGRVVDHNGSAALVPASIQKIYTATVALRILEPDMRYRTEVQRTGELLPDGTLQGDLTLIAGGDPFFTKADLESLAQATAASGIRSVQGSLFIDDTRYDRIRTAPGWKPSYMPRHVGPLSAMAVDLNRWNQDGAFIAEPALGNLDLFRQALAAAGVGVAGPSLLGSPPGGKTVESRSSRPLSEIVAQMLKDSDNFAAELIVKELGRSIGQPSTAGGLSVVAKVARDLGLEPPQAADGSGLSLENRATTRHQVQWLEALGDSPSGKLLQASLPVACGSQGPGWMNKRLCGTPAQGRVAAKTGFLSGVRSLTGYAETASGREIHFSIILIGSSSEQAWTALDQALIAMSSFAG